jgi:hypothetical protein
MKQFEETSLVMFVILITVLSAANCFPGDTETRTDSGTCYCNCAGGGLYLCNNFATRPYKNCPNPVRTRTDIPPATKPSIPTPVNTPIPTPIRTPVKTPIRTPVRTPISTPAKTPIPTGTRPYYCFVTCKRQVLPKTWFLLILGLI